MTNSFKVNPFYNAGNLSMPAAAGKILGNQPIKEDKKLTAIKNGIWVYFFLLIFEGALRKWFLPFLATPLLIVRDPVGIWLLYKAIGGSYFQINNYIKTAWIITILSFVTALLFGHQNFIVAIYGARITAIQFPMIFLIGKIFTKEDVVKVGKIVLWITIPMTVLTAMQFYSPQSAWVNRGVGGDEGGAGFAGAMGFFRPPGTFSFTSGLTAFYSLTGAYLFYFWLDGKQVNKLLLIGVTVCLLIDIPFSISRSLLFQILVSGIFCLVTVASNRKLFPKIILAVFALFIVFTLLSKTAFFQASTEVLTDRFETANEVEGGTKGVFVDRFLGGMINAITDSQGLPFFGYGLGLGTNVGAQVTTGKVGFIFNSEGEWGRVIGEIGIVMGLVIIIMRVQLGFSMLFNSFKAIRYKNILPWLLSSFGVLNVVQGQWAQPTSLGFSVFIGGLILAAFNNKAIENSK